MAKNKQNYTEASMWLNPTHIVEANGTQIEPIGFKAVGYPLREDNSLHEKLVKLLEENPGVETLTLEFKVTRVDKDKAGSNFTFTPKGAEMPEPKPKAEPDIEEDDVPF